MRQERAIGGTMGGRGDGKDWSAAVRVLLAEYGQQPRDLAVSELAGGVENRNLLIEADSERLVLRRYDATPPRRRRKYRGSWRCCAS